MTKLQWRYLRNTLTAWMIMTFVYFTFWWIIPVNFGILHAGFILASTGYGLWFFNTA